MTASDLQTRLDAAVDDNFARQVAWLGTLVRFPSLRGEEAPCQDWIAREFAARGWSIDRYTLSDVAMSHLPGFSPVMDTDYSRAVQVVASLRPRAAKGKSLILQFEHREYIIDWLDSSHVEHGVAHRQFRNAIDKLSEEPAISRFNPYCPLTNCAAEAFQCEASAKRRCERARPGSDVEYF